MSGELESLKDSVYNLLSYLPQVEEERMGITVTPILKSSKVALIGPTGHLIKLLSYREASNLYELLGYAMQEIDLYNKEESVQ